MTLDGCIVGIRTVSELIARNFDSLFSAPLNLYCCYTLDVNADALGGLRMAPNQLLSLSIILIAMGLLVVLCLTGGQHAYFECTIAGRFSHLADPCGYCGDRYFVAMPYFGQHPSIPMTLAYVVLAVGCVMKGVCKDLDRSVGARRAPDRARISQLGPGADGEPANRSMIPQFFLHAARFMSQNFTKQKSPPFVFV